MRTGARRVRVLIHCVYYRPEVGGLESHISGLAEGLVRRGHDVRVLTSRSLPELLREEEIAGVRVRRIWLPARSTVGWATYALASVPRATAWARWADLIHAQSFASVPPAGIAARRAGRPCVASLHTSHFLARARSPLWSALLRRLVLRPDHVFAASVEIAEVAKKLAGGRTVEALPNGVDTDRFRRIEADAGRAASAANGERVVVVPRRLVRKNGVEFLVRAVPEIRSRIPGLRVHVVGDGAERARLEALSSQLGVADTIRFLGSHSHDEMPALLSQAELAVVPSLMEATSVAALEAMACELPVVASAIGGLPEIVDGDVGRLVPAQDPAALAQAVTDLLADRNLRGKGRLARQRVIERWSNERLVDRHLELYGDLLRARSLERSSKVIGSDGR